MMRLMTLKSVNIPAHAQKNDDRVTRARDRIRLALVSAVFTMAGTSATVIVAPAFTMSAAEFVTVLAMIVIVDAGAQDRRADEQAEHRGGFLIVCATT